MAVVDVVVQVTLFQQQWRGTLTRWLQQQGVQRSQLMMKLPRWTPEH
jgi:hypothetical protein